MLAESELEPLVLADGTRIDPTTGKAIKKPRERYVEVPSNTEAQRLVVKTRKTVAELPMPPEQLSGVGLVAFYALFGLPTKEISVALNGKLTVEQIDNIKGLDIYKEFMDNVRETVLESAKDEVRDKFQKHATVAADKIIELAESDSDVLAFKASQDILDRAGHRPVDTVEHKHAMEGGLNIVITRRDASSTVPTIDVTPENVSYAERSR